MPLMQYMPVIRLFLEYFVHFCCIGIYFKLEKVDGEAAR